MMDSRLYGNNLTPWWLVAAHTYTSVNLCIVFVNEGMIHRTPMPYVAACFAHCCSDQIKVMPYTAWGEGCLQGSDGEWGWFWWIWYQVHIYVCLCNVSGYIQCSLWCRVYLHARRRKQLDVNYTLVREWLCRQLDCTEPLDSCTKRSTSTCSSTT